MKGTIDYKQELELTRELGELQRAFSLLDHSKENLIRGERIKAIKEELGLIGTPRKNRRPARVVNR